MNRLQKTLLAISAIVGAIPGLAAFATGFGAPPGSRGIFAIGLQIVAGLAVAGVLLFRERIRQMPAARAAILSVGGGTLTMVLLMTYYWSYDAAVVSHDWYDEPTPVVVPFRVSSWAPPRLDTLVACTRFPGTCAPVTRDYTADHVARVITRYGPDEVNELLVSRERRKTIAGLLGIYSLCILALVLSFSIAAIRLAEDEQR